MKNTKTIDMGKVLIVWFLIMVALKIFKVITFSWWLVFIPTYIYILFFIIITLALKLSLSIVKLLDKHNTTK